MKIEGEHNVSARSYVLDKRRQGNITVFNDDARITVRLHSTNVLVYDKLARTVKLNSGGWRTVTTKTAINRGLSLLGFDGLRISQVKGHWLIAGAEYVDGTICVKDSSGAHIAGLFDMGSIEAYKAAYIG